MYLTLLLDLSTLLTLLYKILLKLRKFKFGHNFVHLIDTKESSVT